MRPVYFFMLTLFLSILNASCTKELKFSKEALLAKAQAADSTVTVILPRNLQEGVHCSDYSSGCISGHIVRIKGLDMLAIEFGHETEAKFAAQKYRGFYSRNWFFDDVVGEPILEKFVETVLEAKKP